MCKDWQSRINLDKDALIGISIFDFARRSGEQTRLLGLRVVDESGISHPIRYQRYNRGIFRVKIIAIKSIISRRYLLITSKVNSRAGFSRPIVKAFRRNGPMRTNYQDVSLSKNIQNCSSMKRKNVESWGKTALDRESIMRSGCLLTNFRMNSFCFRIYLDVECYHPSSYNAGSATVYKGK